MRLAGYCFGAMVLATASTAVRADDLTGQQRFLCTAGPTTVCFSDGECESGPAWSWDVPQFIEVDLDKKRLSSTKASGETRTTPIVNLQRDQGQIILQGYENKRAFSFLIDEKSGWMTVSVARRDVAVSVFGACTPQAAP